MTSKRNKNSSVSKEEEDKALRAYMYGDSRKLLFPKKDVHQCSKNIRHTAFVILNSSNSR